MLPSYDRVPDWHLACAQLSIDFAVAIDQGNFEKVVATFTPEGRLDRMGDVSEGHDALRSWLINDRPTQLIRHVCSNFSAELVSEDTVQGITYFTAYREMGSPQLPIGNTSPAMIGEWHDLFSLTHDGWRIKSRTVKVVFIAR